MDAAEEIRQGLAQFDTRFREEFEKAPNEQGLRASRAQLLGKKGELTRLLRLMGKVPGADRKQIGEAVNAVRTDVESAFEARLREILSAAREADLRGPPEDLSLPGRTLTPEGHVHPLTQVKNEMLDIFSSLGFEYFESLLAVGLCITLDLIRGEHRPKLVVVRWIADEGSIVADHESHFMAEFLELPQFSHRYCVPDVKVGRRRIEAAVHS